MKVWRSWKEEFITRARPRTGAGWRPVWSVYDGRGLEWVWGGCVVRFGGESEPVVADWVRSTRCRLRRMRKDWTLAKRAL